jgi:hypothetical protein
MGYMDILKDSNKMSNFQMVRRQAEREVVRALNKYKESMNEQFPTQYISNDKIYYYLYVCYRDANYSIGHQTTKILAPYLEQLVSMTSHRYLRLLCPLHMTHIIGDYIQQSVSDDNYKIFLSYQIIGVKSMYGRDDEYIHSWSDKIDWFSEDRKLTGARVIRTMYDEISSIVDISLSYPEQLLIWTNIFKYYRSLIQQSGFTPAHIEMYKKGMEMAIK